MTPAELSAGRNLEFTHGRDDLDEFDALVVRLQGGHLIELHSRPPEGYGIDVLVDNADDADAVMPVVVSLLALEPNQFEVFQIPGQAALGP